MLINKILKVEGFLKPSAFIFFLFKLLVVNGQNIQIRSAVDSLAIPNSYIYTNNKLIGISDLNGQYIFKENLLNVEITHVSFLSKDLKEINRDTIIYLKEIENHLKEVEIQKKSSNSILSKIIKNIYSGETNFSFNQSAIVVFKNNNLSIKSIDFEIIDVFGVKNIKYKPFRIGVFNYDQENEQIMNKVYESEILTKHNDKKYFTYFPLKQIEIDSNYFCISFEILDDTFYKPEFIMSNVGTIAAVPSLKLKRINEKKSFRISYDNENNIYKIEKIESGGFNIKINYNEK